MRILFTGAQGTGKTTLLDEYRNLTDVSIITEVVRNLAKEGVKINRDGDEDGQTKIFSKYSELLSDPQNYISDRCLIDVVAYSVYLHNHGKVSEDFVNNQLKALSEWIRNNTDVMYCFFPIEFGVAADGVRDVDEGFRNEISEIILSLLGSFGLRFIVVSGSHEERKNKINRAIDCINFLENDLICLPQVDDEE